MRDDDDKDNAFAQMLLLQSTIQLDACVHDYSGFRPCCRVSIERDKRLERKDFGVTILGNHLFMMTSYLESNIIHDFFLFTNNMTLVYKRA